MKKVITIGAIIVVAVLLLIFFIQRSDGPLGDTVDNIILSLEERDKDLFDKHVDLEKLAENVSVRATGMTLDESEGLSEEDKETIQDLLGDEVTKENKERFIKETEEYFEEERNELVGPLDFLKRNGGSNRSSEIEGGSAKMIYTPPRGVDDTEKTFFFEEKEEEWALIDAQW